MYQCHHTLTINTAGSGFYDITHNVADFINSNNANNGLVTLMVMHTSASLTIQENADPDVCHDLKGALGRIAPESNSLYRHTAEGMDDMPAHIKSALTDVSLSIPVMNGAMRLGTWQGIFLIEHRRAHHRRNIALHFIGE